MSTTATGSRCVSRDRLPAGGQRHAAGMDDIAWPGRLGAVVLFASALPLVAAFAPGLTPYPPSARDRLLIAVAIALFLMAL
jgi:hypothetical protein